VYTTGSDGAVYVGAQTVVGGTGGPPVILARIGDPELGVRAGDAVFVALQATNTFCGTTVDAVFPPGAPELDPSSPLVQVRFPPGFPGFPGGALRLAAVTNPAGCYAGVTGAETGGKITVGVQGWVLTGAQLGYLGRPEVGVPFTLAPRDETAAGLSAEEKAIARKVRRLFYAREGGCPAAAPGNRPGQQVGCIAGFPAMFDPLQPGFALRFTLGLVPPIAPDASTPAVPQPPPGAAVTFSTARGLLPTQRHPSIGGVLPQGIIPYDRTSLAGHENEATRFYVPYADDQVLAYTTADASANVTSIR
jgi:hypothetical protein